MCHVHQTMAWCISEAHEHTHNTHAGSISTRLVSFSRNKKKTKRKKLLAFEIWCADLPFVRAIIYK